MAVIEATTLAQQQWAIQTALVERGFTITRAAPGAYYARLAPRVHRLDIVVAYGRGGIRIDYADSENLLYGHDMTGHEIIHRKYNTWMKNLVIAIQRRLVEASRTPAGRRLPANPTAPPPPADEPASPEGARLTAPRGPRAS